MNTLYGRTNSRPKIALVWQRSYLFVDSGGDGDGDGGSIRLVLAPSQEETAIVPVRGLFLNTEASGCGTVSTKKMELQELGRI